MIEFNQPIDGTVLNLYDVQAGTFGPADVTLQGNTTGPVPGSVIVDLAADFRLEYRHKKLWFFKPWVGIEFTSDGATGEEGYLSDRGLIPMPEDERSEVAANVRELKPLKLASD